MGISLPIVIVADPTRPRLFFRGSEFERQKFAMSLWMACWPVGLVVRDTSDGRWYDVVQYEVTGSDGTPYQHQNLVAVGGDVILESTRNGNLKREVRNEDTMPEMRSQVRPAVGAGLGGK